MGEGANLVGRDLPRHPQVPDPAHRTRAHETPAHETAWTLAAYETPVSDRMWVLTATGATPAVGVHLNVPTRVRMNVASF
ncbi:DUF317 domain-containing protein [Streptomyces albogriseolus]|uniref:DUF317 domain-containing protein n=1 Tax=Streptomyces albogriseolus TaxID=1887 RepID=UPI003F4CB289